jgi:hypothetical protein
MPNRKVGLARTFQGTDFASTLTLTVFACAYAGATSNAITADDRSKKNFAILPPLFTAVEAPTRSVAAIPLVKCKFRPWLQFTSRVGLTNSLTVAANLPLLFLHPSRPEERGMPTTAV